MLEQENLNIIESAANSALRDFKRLKADWIENYFKGAENYQFEVCIPHCTKAALKEFLTKADETGTFKVRAEGVITKKRDRNIDVVTRQMCDAVNLQSENGDKAPAVVVSRNLEATIEARINIGNKPCIVLCMQPTPTKKLIKQKEMFLKNIRGFWWDYYSEQT